MSGLDWLRCPHCDAPLSRVDRTLRCPDGHTFDVARQGYVNLLGRAAPANADTPAMVDARAAFLAGGHYAPLAAAVAAELRAARRVVEVGAGTAYYLARVLDMNRYADGLATDVSPAAAKRAARAHPRAVSIVADTWAGLPLEDSAADAVVCVFAPRNPTEFTRILEPGGRLVVAVPTTAHLAEIRAEYGLIGVAEDKAESIVASLPGWKLERVSTVVATLQLTTQEVTLLMAMGPNAFHGIRAANGPATTTLSVRVLTLIRPSEDRASP